MYDRISSSTYKTITDENGRCEYGTYWRPDRASMRETISILSADLFYFENLCSEHRIHTKQELEKILDNHADTCSQLYHDIRKKFLEDIANEIKENQQNAINTYFEKHNNTTTKQEE